LTAASTIQPNTITPMKPTEANVASFDRRRLLIELFRQRGNRGTAFRKPAVANLAVLVGAALQFMKRQLVFVSSSRVLWGGRNAGGGSGVGGGGGLRLPPRRRDGDVASAGFCRFDRLAAASPALRRSRKTLPITADRDMASRTAMAPAVAPSPQSLRSKSTRSAVHASRIAVPFDGKLDWNYVTHYNSLLKRDSQVTTLDTRRLELNW
jgi:hypothetical protein